MTYSWSTSSLVLWSTLDHRTRLEVDHKLALVARIVAEETVSRAASQLSAAMHREENALAKEEKKNDDQICVKEKSKSEVGVVRDLDAEVLRLGIMSPATPQVEQTMILKVTNSCTRTMQIKAS